jgi:hypothetical protein
VIIRSLLKPHGAHAAAQTEFGSEGLTLAPGLRILPHGCPASSRCFRHFRARFRADRPLAFLAGRSSSLRRASRRHPFHLCPSRTLCCGNPLACFRRHRPLSPPAAGARGSCSSSIGPTCFLRSGHFRAGCRGKGASSTPGPARSGRLRLTTEQATELLLQQGHLFSDRECFFKHCDRMIPERLRL